MSDDLPQGWVLTTLGEVCSKPQYGWTTSARKSGRGLKLLRTSDISGGTIDWTSVPVCEDTPANPSKYRLHPGDIVVSRAGSVGLSHIVRSCPPAVFASYLIRLRPLAEVSSEFVALFLNSPRYWKAIAEEAAGIAVQNVNATKLGDLELPLPPLAEQRRIATAIEALQERVNAARKRLAKVRSFLKRFRQAVLAAACSGRLTDEWREGRPDASDDLVQAVHEARGGLGLALHSSEPTREFDFELPAEWQTVSADFLMSRVTSGSRGWTRYYADDGRATFVMAQNVRPLRFDRTFRQGVEPLRREPEAVRTHIEQNDILVTIVGANTGDVCRVDVAVEDHYVCQSVALMRPVIPVIAPFVELWLNSPEHGRRQYLSWIYGEGRPHLSFDHLRETAIALPPLAEQGEILRRVRSLFALAEAVERRVQGATARADRIMEGILTRAFRGELVPTEAELAREEGRPYEPANVLIERVRRARGQSDAAPTGSRKRRAGVRAAAGRGRRGR